MMQKKMVKKILLMMSALAVAGVIFSCGGAGDTKTSTSHSYGGTQAPGDYWEWVIEWKTSSTGTFSATNYGTTAGKTAANTYSGTTSILDSKFIKFVISTTTDTSVAAGDAFYGVEIPGTAILIQTAGNSPRFVTCSFIGTVPSSSTTYNWTRIPDASTMDNHTTTSGIVSYGTAEISFVSGVTYQSSDTVYDWNKSLVSSSVSSMVFSGGKLFSPDLVNPATVTLMAKSGCFVSDMGTNGGCFGSIAPSSDISIDDLVSHEYRGYCTIYNSSSSTDVYPVYCKPSTTAKRMLSASYSDVDTGTVASSGECEVNFDAAVQSSPGLLFNISSINPSPDFDESIVTAVAKIDGKYVISGFGRVRFSTGEPYRWENFIMVQVD